MTLQEFLMNPSHRRDLHLVLTGDQFDDLDSALESHRNWLQRLAAEAVNGFGLEASYWEVRVNEVQALIDAIHHPRQDDETK